MLDNLVFFLPSSQAFPGGEIRLASGQGRVEIIYLLSSLFASIPWRGNKLAYPLLTSPRRPLDPKVGAPTARRSPVDRPPTARRPPAGPGRNRPDAFLRHVHRFFWVLFLGPFLVPFFLASCGHLGPSKIVLGRPLGKFKQIWEPKMKPF